MPVHRVSSSILLVTFLWHPVSSEVFQYIITVQKNNFYNHNTSSEVAHLHPLHIRSPLGWYHLWSVFIKLLLAFASIFMKISKVQYKKKQRKKVPLKRVHHLVSSWIERKKIIEKSFISRILVSSLCPMSQQKSSKENNTPPCLHLDPCKLTLPNVPIKRVPRKITHHLVSTWILNLENNTPPCLNFDP